MKFPITGSLDCTGAWIKTGNSVLARWEGRAVRSITRQDVLSLLDDMAEYPVKANRTLSALKTFFRWRMKRDEGLVRSPCDGIDNPHPEADRERVLTDPELAALWRAADAIGHPFGTMVQLLILTGLRRDEARCASWPEIDLETRQWLIPGTRTKNGHDHLVPLSDQSAAVLRSLPRFKSVPLLFSTTGRTPISGLNKARYRLHDLMARELGEEPDRWTFHDLRRTCYTGLQRLGFPLEVAEAVTNHRSGTLKGVAKVYARHSYGDEKRRALDDWARHVAGIVTDGSVVPFVRAASAGATA